MDALHTDLYQRTMAAGYFHRGMASEAAIDAARAAYAVGYVGTSNVEAGMWITRAKPFRPVKNFPPTTCS